MERFLQELLIYFEGNNNLTPAEFKEAWKRLEVEQDVQRQSLFALLEKKPLSYLVYGES